MLGNKARLLNPKPTNLLTIQMLTFYGSNMSRSEAGKHLSSMSTKRLCTRPSRQPTKLRSSCQSMWRAAPTTSSFRFGPNAVSSSLRSASTSRWLYSRPRFPSMRTLSWTFSIPTTSPRSDYSVSTAPSLTASLSRICSEWVDALRTQLL